MNLPRNNKNLVIETANEQELTVDEPPLVNAVREILVDHDFQSGEVSIAIVDDPRIRELNREYLDHDYETDVLSFVLDLDSESGFIEGQLIVSNDTADQSAAELGIPRQNELLLYVIHGALHLVGYRDKTPEEAREMRLAESEYLARLWRFPSLGRGKRFGRTVTRTEKGRLTFAGTFLVNADRICHDHARVYGCFHSSGMLLARIGRILPSTSPPRTLWSNLRSPRTDATWRDHHSTGNHIDCMLFDGRLVNV